MSNDKTFPDNWHIASDYDPNAHQMSLKGKAYLDVQNRLIWFVRDQRDFIARGLATTSYCIRTELVEQDRERGFAQFKTYVRDVLGNEATMYGSETAKDFGDYAEKASTKSLGRALAMLGYGTQFAPEMDEGERVVDSPVERRAAREAQPASAATVEKPTPTTTSRQFATPAQWTAIHSLCGKIGCPAPEPGSLTTEQAGALIAEYSETWKLLVAKRQREGART